MYRQFTKKEFRRKGKYNNNSSFYGGNWYHSVREANHAEELDWRKKAGEVKEWTRQFKISLDVNGKHIANYFIDFRVELADGEIEYHEVKGFRTPDWELKWKLTQALYPEWNLVLIT